jgi:hypothetical protein
MRFTEFPATIISTEVVRHMSTKKSRWGVMVGKTNKGKFTVNTVAPSCGRLMYHAFAVCDTEQAARARANQAWVSMGL